MVVLCYSAHYISCSFGASVPIL